MRIIMLRPRCVSNTRMLKQKEHQFNAPLELSLVTLDLAEYKTCIGEESL